jgi:diacylglycerol kinase (ATP)
MSRRALFLVNHRSRSGREFSDRARSALVRFGFDLVDVPRASKETPSQALLALGKRGASIAIIGGGDGTLNGAIDALARLKVRVGILPLGTANDFARTLGIPQDLEGACRVIAGGRTKSIDLGTVNGKFFLNDASMGVSSTIAARLTRSAKKRWGVFAAAGIALRAVRGARRFTVDIRCDRRTISASAYQVTIGNGVFLGGVVTNHDASVRDGLLDMYVLESKRAADVVRMLPYAAAGIYDANPFVLTAKGKRFVVKTSRRLRIFTDGEPAGTTPATIAVVPKALRVFVP